MKEKIERGKKSRIHELYEDEKEPKGRESKKATKEASEEEAAFIRTLLDRAAKGETYWSDNREGWEDDLKFLNGEQWPSTVKAEREAEGRPCLTNNVLPSFVDQVLGDQRQNRPSIKINAVDPITVKNQEGKPEKLKISNTAGSNDYELAEVYTGLVKNIEYNCDAETEYDMAFQCALESGAGFLRTRTDYISHDSFDQDIVIECIQNQFSVTIDPNAKKRDKSDMNWCLIDDVMSRDAFERKFPDAIIEAPNDSSASWYPEDSVRVSEYFIRKPVIKEIALLSDGTSFFLDELEPIIDELKEKGLTIKRTRKVKSHKVLWHKVNGSQILEGPIEVKNTTIPVVPVWGKSIRIRSKEIFRSLIRHSKDAQAMANFWDSAATESVALAPKAPYVGTEEQVEGRETEWQNANKSPKALLTYIPGYQGDPGPRRSQAAQVPAAEITMAMNAGDKVKSTMGMFDASIGAQGNETSGKAIIARQRQGDRGSFAFIDNLSKSIARIGKLIVELAPYVYDAERIVRLKFADDTEDYVQLNKQVFDEESQKWVTIHDLGVQKYDVVVTTGPSYSTQRIEAAESMISFAQSVPQAAGVMADLIALNMDWPGADAISERLKKIIPPNVLNKDEREKMQEDMPEQTEPTPEQQMQMAEIELKGKQIESDNMKAQASIAQAEADMLEAQLDTDDAKAKLAQINNMADTGNQFAEQVRGIVAEAIAELTNS